jgi:hypothetical protein
MVVTSWIVSAMGWLVTVTFAPVGKVPLSVTDNIPLSWNCQLPFWQLGWKAWLAATLILIVPVDPATVVADVVAAVVTVVDVVLAFVVVVVVVEVVVVVVALAVGFVVVLVLAVVLAVVLVVVVVGDDVEVAAAAVVVTTTAATGVKCEAIAASSIGWVDTLDPALTGSKLNK